MFLGKSNHHNSDSHKTGIEYCNITIFVIRAGRECVSLVNFLNTNFPDSFFSTQILRKNNVVHSLSTLIEYTH